MDSGFRRNDGSTGGLVMPAPVERQRFLGLELAPEALADARALIAATGEVEEPYRIATWFASATASR
jgi:hypothetical protein